MTPSKMPQERLEGYECPADALRSICKTVTAFCKGTLLESPPPFSPLPAR
jgi:hypothetical protein